MICGILLFSLAIASTLTYYNEIICNFCCPSNRICNNMISLNFRKILILNHFYHFKFLKIITSFAIQG